MRVLLTRPEEDSRALAATLEPEGVTCLIWPMTRIVPTAEAVRIPPATGGLLFTSANGVRAFAGIEPRRDLPAFCVGDATAAEARRAGFADVRSAAGDGGGDARALADLARRSGVRAFLHARGRHAAGDLAGRLRESGREVAEAVLYEAVEGGPPPADVAGALSRGEVGLVTVWSRRAAAILAGRLAGMGAALAGTDLLAISPAAAEPLAGAGFRRSLVAGASGRAPGGASMLERIRAVARLRQ